MSAKIDFADILKYMVVLGSFYIYLYMYCSFIQHVIMFRAGRLIRIKPKSQYGLWHCVLVQAALDSGFFFFFLRFINVHLGTCANPAENKDIRTAINISIVISQLYCKIIIIIIIIVFINFIL